jgi:hypothetical protein
LQPPKTSISDAPVHALGRLPGLYHLEAHLILVCCAFAMLAQEHSSGSGSTRVPKVVATVFCATPPTPPPPPRLPTACAPTPTAACNSPPCASCAAHRFSVLRRDLKMAGHPRAAHCALAWLGVCPLPTVQAVARAFLTAASCARRHWLVSTPCSTTATFASSSCKGAELDFGRGLAAEVNAPRCGTQLVQQVSATAVVKLTWTFVETRLMHRGRKAQGSLQS